MRVLLTGSTGYIGRRLKKRVIEDKSIKLRLFVRNENSVSKRVKDGVEIVEGDTFNKESLKLAMQGVDIAYYLIHSLDKDNYKELDRVSAENFIEAASQAGVKKVIYLGGLGVKNEHTSKHLLSRIETGEILSSNNSVQVIWIRAGVIIGSGSASFEIIRNLVEKLPIMTTPKWVNTLAQPIAVDDVISYLFESIKLDYDRNLIVDIGSEKLSYKDMMLKTAQALGLKRRIITFPLMTINISSYWLNIFTPVPFRVAKALIEGLESEVVIQNKNANKYFPQINPITYLDAVKKAESEIESNQVISRWSDNSGRVWDEVHTKEFSDAIFVDREVRDISHINSENVYNSFISIGGDNGWFDFDLLWEFRGLIDKLLGGAGLNRGRRNQYKLRVGDSLDFWKVVDLQENQRMLLFAQMKLPGKAWLEFKIENNRLIQSAYFYPKGLLGRLYWYTLIPLHYFVFKNMINCIIEKGIKDSNEK